MSKETPEHRHTKEERDAIKRQKQLAFMKAQKQLLIEARAKALEIMDEDDEKFDEVLDSFDDAFKENREMLTGKLMATEYEMEQAQYREPSKRYIKMYEKHLKARGLTDEEVRRKDLTEGTGKIAEAVMSAKTKNKGNKEYSFSKKNREKKSKEQKK